MGQSLQKLAPGSEERKIKEIIPIIESCYEKNLKDAKNLQFEEFYRIICDIVEKINENLKNTQFKLPPVNDLKDAFDKHHGGEKRKEKLEKEDFHEILKEVMTKGSSIELLTGIGAKEALMYIFGVPLATLFLKRTAMPNALPDDFFIPGVTSLTVLILAALNKI
ncbi:hypothetical protein HN51_015111 [Arachis hypogaea]|uniref:Uncharacterized protein n=1 Tax=Arachis hypogaea TaxID=3818 RepID=A0A445CLZ9_ARAHY|nr:uncharacterized protein LOC112695939 [Arachis hypogaea]QHO44883.1 uncharacterized protein DS421_6g174490 [Arachis hypogaea]RYR51954.1 hypothetical protein Ahy_A06g026894 [Arachis hypogaea]